MARERWFYSRDNQRMGPMTLQELVEGLLVLPEPTSYLVWNRDLPGWTRAGAVPAVESRLAPYVSRPASATATAQAVGVGASLGPDEAAVTLPPPPEEALAPPPPTAPLIGGPWLYLAGGAFAAFLAFGVWSMWPRGENPADGRQEGPAVIPLAGSVEAASSGSPGPTAPAGGGETVEGRAAAGAAFSEPGDVETDLPRSAIPKLRGVAAWKGRTLTLTLYNGTTFRVTEVFVRVSRLEGDEFVDSVSLSRLRPPSGNLDGGIAGMMDQVAPDRKKPGVNPLDTGPFEAEVGPQPEAYRWRIEGARGYAFRPVG